MLKVREYFADEFTLTSALRCVSVIDIQADWLVMLSLCTAADLTQQLEVHRIQQFAPLDITVIHKSIEHVHLTTEQTAYGRARVPVCIPDDEEREKHQKIQHLHVSKLAVLLLLRPYLARTYVYALHHSHNRINCTVILTF